MKTKTELDQHFETRDCESAARFHLYAMLALTVFAAIVAFGLVALVFYIKDHLPKDFAQWEAFGITVGFICVAYVVMHMVVKRIKN